MLSDWLWLIRQKAIRLLAGKAMIAINLRIIDGTIHGHVRDRWLIDGCTIGGGLWIHGEAE